MHGDDYASTGTLEDLKWLQTELEIRFDMKTQVIGHSGKEGVVEEARILNRIVRATRDGWEYECDQRHVEIILEQLELKDARPLGTPGIEDGTTAGEEEDEHPLSADLTSLYRTISARANYSAQDRSDIQYAVKELCRRMSAPTKGDMKKLVRLGRYLVGKPRAVALYPWQAARAVQDVFTDANWAGCKASRKSTSGGAMLLGSHVVRTWSRPRTRSHRAALRASYLRLSEQQPKH